MTNQQARYDRLADLRNSKVTDMTVSTCRFCALIQNSAEVSVDTPWLADSRYFAVASVGALIEGWSLVCPQEHALNLRDHFGADEFWAFANRAIDVVRNKYGPVVLFEHGAVCDNSETSCGTAHAHLHVVPLAVDLAQLVMGRDSSLTWIECAAENVVEVAAGQEYLFVISEGSSQKARGRLAILEAGQSQFFRKVIADWLGRASEYSYKTHPQTETSLQTAIALRAEAQGISLLANAA